MSETSVDKPEKLIRCVCGEVFNSIRRKKCPECGHPIQVSQKAAPEVPPASSDEIQETGATAVRKPLPAWKIAAGAVCFLFALMLLKGVSGFFKHAGNHRNAPKAELVPAPNIPAKPATVPAPVVPAQPAPEQKTLPAVVPSNNPSYADYWNSRNVRSDLVDPSFVGTWVNFVNVSGASQRWVLRIGADGRYQMAATGGGVNVNQSGNFTAKNLQWSMKADDGQFDDAGDFKWLSSVSFQLVSPKGVMTWTKEGYNPNNYLPPAMQQEWNQVKEEAKQKARSTFENILNGLNTAGTTARR